jgi:integrase
MSLMTSSNRESTMTNRRRQTRSPGQGSVMKVPGRKGWQSEIVLPGGRRLNKQHPTKKAAEEWAVSQLQLARSGQLASRRSVTLDDWMKQWMALRVRAYSTKELERIHYQHYFNSLAQVSIDKLTPMVLRHHFETMELNFVKAKPPLGRPHTVRLCHSLLRTALGDAVEAGVLAVNPMHAVKRPRIPRSEPKYLALDEVGRVLKAVTSSGEVGAIAVHLMLRLGLRRGEALGLLWENIDFETGAVAVEQQLQRVPNPLNPEVTHLDRVTLKTQGSRRILVADDSLVAMLKDLRGHQLTRSGPRDYVVAQLDGSPIDPSNFTKWLAAVGKSINVHVSPHRLRHTAATLMLNQAVPLTTIGSVLGHTDARTTLIYARVTGDTRSAALSGLGQLLDTL